MRHQGHGQEARTDTGSNTRSHGAIAKCRVATRSEHPTTGLRTRSEARSDPRAAEAKELAHEGFDPVLKHSRWCLLKRPENLTDKQGTKLNELMRYQLKSIRAYLLKDSFQAL